MNKKIILIAFFLLINLSLFSQVQYINISNKFQRTYENEALKTDYFHTNIKPYNKKNIQNYNPSSSDSCTALFNKKSKIVSVLPIAGAEVVYDNKQKNTPFFAYAGVSLHSEFVKNISFHADIYGNYYKAPSFLTALIDSTKIIPHNGFVLSNKNGQYLYLNTNAYLSYMPEKYLNIEIGKGKHFFGDGYRSLFLSDNSNASPYAKIDVEIWKIKYIYLISKQKDYDLRFADQKLSNKFTASHYLSLNITKWLNINMFETVIGSPIDSMGANRGFDYNYLNPVIFFRPVDLSQGSPDNVIVGMGGSLKLMKTTQLYGQGVLDEFMLSRFIAGKGWWGNKYGLQAGIKSFKTLFIKNLYSQFEINFVRPFTYSHSEPISSYGNYGQALAHPLGANFEEGTAILSYSVKKLSAQMKITYSIYGQNKDTINYGQNIYRSYHDRTLGDEGYFLTNGIRTKVLYSEFKMWYPIVNELFFAEVGVAYRRETSSINNQENMLFFVGIKSPIGNKYYDF